MRRRPAAIARAETGATVRPRPAGLADHRHAGDEAFGQIQVVRGEHDDRAVRGELAEAIRDEADGAVVEAGERFVEQQEPGRCSSARSSARRWRIPRENPDDIVVAPVGEPRALEGGIDVARVKPYSSREELRFCRADSSG